MTIARGLRRSAAYLALGTSVLGCYGLFPADNAYTIVNRTTVPVVLVDKESVSVVAACSERTLGYSEATWGGNGWGGKTDAGGRYVPVVEPVPPDAWVLPAQYVYQPFEGPMVVRMVVASWGVGRDLKEDSSCEGLPPASATPVPASAPAPSLP